MKLEIELDLNKIDYDAINQQIRQKLEMMNLEEDYHIKDKIKQTIDTEVQALVYANMCDGYYWNYNADYNTKNTITNELKVLIQETLKPKIEEYFKSLPEDKIENLILDMVPKIFMEVIKSKCEDIYYNAAIKEHENNFIYLQNEICNIKSHNY